jgi:predicted small metal-binding protein
MGMKQFWCGAVIPECGAKFSGENEDAILHQVAAHAKHDHGISEIPASVLERVRELIRDAG